MRDRLVLMNKILRIDGMIFIQRDDEMLAHLKLILDEIFGQENFITTISVKMSRSTGVKMAHVEKKPSRYKEHILLYAKSKDNFKVFPQYIKLNKWDKRYNSYITNFESNPKEWKIQTLTEVFKLKILQMKMNSLILLNKIQ